MRSMLLLTLFALCSASLLEVVQNLPLFQAENGGFRNAMNQDVSLQATSQALLISTLFGLRNHINAYQISSYLATLENADGGYGAVPGAPSDIESTKLALLSLYHAGLPLTNSASALKFIRSLNDASSGLYSRSVGATADLESSVFAFQAFEYLDELSRAHVSELKPKISAYLEAHWREDHFRFEEEQDLLSEITANYYAVVLGNYVGFEFDENLAFWFEDQRTPDGYFRGSAEQSSLTVTAHATIALSILGQAASDSIIEFLNYNARDVITAATAFHAFALTPNFRQLFSTQITYEALGADSQQHPTAINPGEHIVQGTQLRALAIVRPFNGWTHSGLDLDVEITYADQEPVVVKLQWAQEARQYVASEVYDTENKLGALTFDLNVRFFVMGVGDLSFTHRQVTPIGYKFAVEVSAQNNGDSFFEKQVVPIGTDFSFTVSLSTKGSAINSGNFDMLFDVLDASNVLIHQQKIDCSSRSASSALQFTYTLTATNIPSGAVHFRFAVRDHALSLVHSTHTLTYNLEIPLIATEITFSSQRESFQLGHGFDVTMVPATYLDSKIATFASRDLSGTSIGSERRFTMDVSSASGARLFSVDGVASEDGARLVYTFHVNIAASLDSIGENRIGFTFHAARDSSSSSSSSSPVTTQLINYDSSNDSILSAENSPKYLVKAELFVSEIAERPQASLSYGNQVSFRFKIRDALTERVIRRSQSDAANVFLLLRHVDQSDASARPFVSVRQPAVFESDWYTINWTVNPNAVRGEGKLVIVAHNADGKELPIFSNKDEPVEYDVSIGGSINVKHESFSLEQESQTAFFVSFVLDCEGHPLRDARLRSLVYRDGSSNSIAHTPVALGEDGQYQTSWIVKSSEAPSAQYSLKFYRETDIERALEQRARKGTASSKPIEDEVEPLFQVSITHQAAPKAILPVRTELLVAFILLLSFVWVSVQKN